MFKSFHDGLSLSTRRKIVFFLLGLIVGFLLLSIVFQACGGTLSAIKERLCATNDAHMRADRLVNVEALPAKIGTMTKRVTAVGRTKANEFVVIKSEIHARLKEILFTEGGTVTKDQEIFRFENSDVQAELQEAEANLVLTKSNFERTAKLHEQKIGSAKEYDKSKGEFDAASARVAVLKAKLEKTIIKAPFSGQIGIVKEDVNVGGFVQSGAELVTLVQTNPMKIDFKVPEKFVHDVGVGQSAEVRIDAFKDRVFLASVEAVDSKVDSDSHSLALRATTDNDNGDLIAGLFANVSLIIGERGNTVMVDESAIVREGTIETVWVIEKGKARQKLVKTGVREKNMVEIIAGINQGEIVVTTGQQRLQNGVRVKVVNDKEEIERERLAKEKAEKEKRAKEEGKVASSDKKVDAKPETTISVPVSENKVVEQSSVTKAVEMPKAEEIVKSVDRKEIAKSEDAARTTQAVKMPETSKTTEKVSANFVKSLFSKIQGASAKTEQKK